MKHDAIRDHPIEDLLETVNQVLQHQDLCEPTAKRKQNSMILQITN